jgi:hypothetical protein
MLFVCQKILAKKSFKKKRPSLSFIKSDEEKKNDDEGEGHNEKKKGNKKRKKMDRLDRKVEKHLRRDEPSMKKPFSML